MADKIKILIVDDCKIGGKHIDQGTVIDIDPDVAADRNNYALLVHAGRIAEASDENIAKVKAARTARLATKAAAKKAASGQTGAEALAAAIVTALIDGGILKAPAKAAA